MKQTIFKPEIKDKNCKHKWTKLNHKCERKAPLVGSIKIEFDFLFCEKCGSTNGEPVYN